MNAFGAGGFMRRLLSQKLKIIKHAMETYNTTHTNGPDKEPFVSQLSEYMIRKERIRFTRETSRFDRSLPSTLWLTP